MKVGTEKTLPSLVTALILALSPLAFASPIPITAAAPCSTAAHDRNVFASGLHHDSFDSFFRSPFGAQPTSSPGAPSVVQLRFRTCQNDVDRVRLRIWDSSNHRETWIPLNLEPEAGTDATFGPVEYWSVNLLLPEQPTVLYYFFEISDQGDTHYYVANDPANFGGGPGVYSRDWDDSRSYQLTVYDRKFTVPSWLKGALIYQIFPDRFRNGNQGNDPVSGGGFIYGQGYRTHPWSDPLCDPRGPGCPNEFGNQFYGGDLDGVIEKLDYLKSLHVSAIYLNPIFLAATNHGYDTQDYFTIDPKLGDSRTFEKLAHEAAQRGIRLILDGVFNHMSSDSPAFDLFGRWNDVGACESVNSKFRSWFYLPARYNPAGDPSRPGAPLYCAGTNGSRSATYEAWWGVYELPVFNRESQSVRDLIYARGAQSVGPYWLLKGSSGWRLDVGGELDPGQGVDPFNRYWEEFRTAIKATSPNAVIIGEEWGNASPWLTGWEWDSVMNYRFRDAVLGWLTDGCQGLGCTSGLVFQDNNNRVGRANGPLYPLRDSQFDLKLKGIQENYPPQSWHAMLNLLGSHDTNRVLFMLKKLSHDDETLALRKLVLASLFQFTYPGAPTVFYGDEAGVKAEARWYDNTWFSDPYSRAVYPWADEGLTPHLGLLAHYQRLGEMRSRHPALSHGQYQTDYVDDQRRIFAFRRFTSGEEAFVILNRSEQPNRCQFRLPSRLDGAVMNDVLSNESFRVQGGVLDCGQIEGLWGRVLIPQTGGSSVH